jgi:hypothetical protein
MKTGLGNLAATDIDQLTAIVRNRLKRVRYRPALIDGLPAESGLSLEPESPGPQTQPFNLCGTDLAGH